MTPVEWITFGQLVISAGREFAVAWAELLEKTKGGAPVTVEERKAACAKIVYKDVVTNSRLPQAG